MFRRVTNSLSMFIKLAIVAAMIGWMIRSGKLDLASLAVFWDHPWALIGNIIYWLIFVLFLGAMRWFLLLRGMGISAGFIGVLRLTLIGFFFNSAMPGAVGGDVIKGLYLAKNAQRGQKGASVITILMDRVVGLFGLFTFGAFIALIAWNGISQNPVLRSMSLIVVGNFFVVLLFFAHIFYHSKKFDVVDKVLHVRFLRRFRGLYHSLLIYQEAKINVLLAWLISFCIQAASIVLFWKMAVLLNGEQINFVKFCTAAPLAILATAVPLAPGGMGVGHLAFDRILGGIGVQNGANVFNVVFICQMSLNMLGFIPYLFQKKHSSAVNPAEIPRVNPS